MSGGVGEGSGLGVFVGAIVMAAVKVGTGVLDGAGVMGEVVGAMVLEGGEEHALPSKVTSKRASAEIFMSYLAEMLGNDAYADRL